jgi:hypothetical protein
MEPARQLIRWSIPGSVVLLTMASEEVVAAIAFNVSRLGSRFMAELDPAAAIFVLALGVPIGFLMYQVYFYFWGRAGSLAPLPARPSRPRQGDPAQPPPGSARRLAERDHDQIRPGR